jgi:hypothetical protein
MIKMVKLYIQILLYSMYEKKILDQIEIHSIKYIKFNMILLLINLNTFLTNDVQSRLDLFSVIIICLLSGTDIVSWQLISLDNNGRLRA